MTPEERVDALKGLLGRLRTNAGGRLVVRSGDEEEFVPRSVLAARKEAAEAALIRAAAEATAVGATPPAEASPVDATRPVDASPADAGRTNGASNGASNGATVERYRFVPDDARLDTEPPPTAIPGGGGGSIEEALRQVEDAALAVESGPEPIAAALRPEPAPQLESAPPLELDLYDDAFDEPTATGAPDEIEALALDEIAPPPREHVARPPAPPTSSTRAVSSPPQGLLQVEDADEEEEAPLPESWAVERTSRRRDPLAQTAQNPIPAEMFERAVAEGRELDELQAGEASAAKSEEAPAPPTAPGGGRDEAPISSRQPVDLDRALDDGLDSEPPPQSGEIASQRQPAAASRSFDLDEPTPTTEQGAHVAREAERLLAESLPSAPPPTRPGIVGRRPLAAASFLQVLDAALELGEGPG